MKLDKIRNLFQGRNLRIFRFIIQLSSFLLFNFGFYIYIQYLFVGIILPINSGFGSQFTIIQGAWNVIERSLSLAIIPFLAIGILILFSILFGRLTCGWICPFGFIQDMISKLPTKKTKLKQETEGTFAWLVLIIIGISLIAALFVGYLPIIRGDVAYLGPFTYGLWSQLDPYNFLFSILPQTLRENTLNLSVGFFEFFVQNPIFVVQVIFTCLVFALQYWLTRIYCRFLCPTGGCMGYLSNYGFLGLKRDPVTCNKCRKCEDACPMNVPILKLEIKRMRHRSCILCLECVASCPEKSLKIAFS
ncbi:MAG: 4Fe-4S binding protein [Candidatus Lokiarchaeota archaeon]|nr:4Fe-4S binding protein [Candidatus Lokiarchaeota archaeon]